MVDSFPLVMECAVQSSNGVHFLIPELIIVGRGWQLLTPEFLAQIGIRNVKGV